MLKVEAVRVTFLSYSEEAVRQRPFPSPGGRARGVTTDLQGHSAFQSGRLKSVHSDTSP